MTKFDPTLLAKLDIDTLENVLESFRVSFKEYENILEPRSKKIEVAWPSSDIPDLKFKVVEFHFKDELPSYFVELEEELEPTTIEEERELEPLSSLIEKNPRLIRSIDDYSIITVAWTTLHQYDGINNVYIPLLGENFYYEVMLNGKEYRINVVNGICYNERIF